MSRTKNSWSLGDIIIGIIAVLGIIFFIGELFANSKEEAPVKPKIKPENDLEKKKKRLQFVEDTIAELEPQRQKLFKNQKRIIIGSRMAIAFFIVLINGTYFWFVNRAFDLGSQLNINAAILMGYSFVAFVVYGTPKKLVKEIKRKSKRRLKRKHIPILSELRGLESERNILIPEIKKLREIEVKGEIVKLRNPDPSNNKELVPS